jgi:hypothetical protein
MKIDVTLTLENDKKKQTKYKAMVDMEKGLYVKEVWKLDEKGNNKKQIDISKVLSL